MLSSNFREIRDLGNLAKKFGVKQVVCSNLALIFDKTLWPEALFSSEKEERKFNVILDKIADEARENDLFFRVRQS